MPADHLLGAEGRGFGEVLRGFDFSRALIGLQCIGAAQQTVDETWEYVTLLTAARLLCRETLWRGDAGLPHTAQAAMCKWWAPRTAHEVITQCLLLHGQYGYRTGLPIEQRLRDVLGLL